MVDALVQQGYSYEACMGMPIQQRHAFLAFLMERRQQEEQAMQRT
jgi:hypothetical protein